jgi:beta-mannosidase
MKVCAAPSTFSSIWTILDYQLAESLGLELDYSDEKSDYRKTDFPARHIYERVLPEIVKKHCDVYYHRGSPYSGRGKPTTDQTLGDLHQCTFESCSVMPIVTIGLGNVWHGSQEPWQNWDILAGRFVSEFGMYILTCPVYMIHSHSMY